MLHPGCGSRDSNFIFIINYTLTYDSSLDSCYNLVLHSIQIQPVLLKVFSFYSRSPKRYRELKDVAKAKQENVIALKRAEGTRWEAHRLKAMEALHRNYPSLITHWEDVSSPARADVKDTDKAVIKGFLKRLKTLKFIAYFAFYMDLLASFSAISAVFQRADLSLQEVKETVKTNLTSLKQLKAQEGNVSTLMVDQFRKDVADAEGEESEEDKATYRGVDCQGHLEDIEPALVAEKNRATSTIVKKMEDRFADFVTDPILQSCEVFDHTIWPEEEEKLSSYGVEAVSILLEHFMIPLSKQGVNLMAAKREWAQLKTHIAAHYQHLEHTSMWKAIFLKKQKTFPNILHLVAIVLSKKISFLIICLYFLRRLFIAKGLDSLRGG